MVKQEGDVVHQRVVGDRFAMERQGLKSPAIARDRVARVVAGKGVAVAIEIAKKLRLRAPGPIRERPERNRSHRQQHALQPRKTLVKIVLQWAKTLDAYPRSIVFRRTELGGLAGLRASQPASFTS
jgi:hypothetical protein